MENRNEKVKNLYTTDEYILRHPSLHEEDSNWKVSKIIPAIDKFAGCRRRSMINLLDVGGGAGLILGLIAAYVEKNHNMIVSKFSLDLSPGILEIQKKRNPDLKKVLNEDICRTSLGNKEVDLTLMIDILEHVPNPIQALEELRRISRYVIFKVPLEDNLLARIWDLANRGKPRKKAIENIGHINVYKFDKLRCQIERHTGRVLSLHFTNVFDYYLHSNYYRNRMKASRKLVNLFAVQVFRLSPVLCSLIFTDFAIILVECY